MAARSSAPQRPFPPLPLLPGQLPRVRTAWTRLTFAIGVTAAILTPWLLLHLAVGVYFLQDVGSDWGPEYRTGVRVYLAYVSGRVLLAAGLALECWRRSRALRRTGGRPTRRGAVILLSYAALVAVLAVDAFTFALIRMWDPSAL